MYIYVLFSIYLIYDKCKNRFDQTKLQMLNVLARNNSYKYPIVKVIF